jgi:hypothetical protein
MAHIRAAVAEFMRGAKELATVLRPYVKDDETFLTILDKELNNGHRGLFVAELRKTAAVIEEESMQRALDATSRNKDLCKVFIDIFEQVVYGEDDVR